MVNRIRNNGIYIILSDQELELLNKKFESSNCRSFRQFIMKSILENDIYVLDMNVFRDMSTNISGTSGNINRIAKRINSTSVIYKDDISDLKIMLEKQSNNVILIRKKLYSLSHSQSIFTEKK